MKELLTYILEKLCSKPEDIKVDVVENGNNIDIIVDVTLVLLLAVVEELQTQLEPWFVQALRKKTKELTYLLNKNKKRLGN